ncbi:MAG: AraC family transcriptional regulator [Alistipes sp.]|nr:AraC family transcriptional regulator [Candidatus Alistipes equi]
MAINGDFSCGSSLERFLDGAVDLAHIQIRSYSIGSFESYPFELLPLRLKSSFVLLCEKGHIEITTHILASSLFPKQYIISPPAVLKLAIFDECSFKIILPDTTSEGVFNKNKSFPLFDSRLSSIHLTKHFGCLSGNVFDSIDFNSLALSRSFSESFVDALCSSFYFDATFSVEGNQSNTSQHGKMYDKFLRFIELLGQNCVKEHSLDFYASKLNVTEKHLGKISLLCSSWTAKRWLERALLLQTEFLLLNTNLSPLKISEELLFSSPSYFGQFFRRLEGVSPGRFRQNFLQKQAFLFNNV